MKTLELQDLTAVAVEIAKDAGSRVRNSSVGIREVVSDLRRDVKVKADYELEAFIVKCLSQKTDLKILTEEKGLIEETGGDSSYCWIVDPLDGSVNFSREIPISCISIGLWKETVPLLGVIYDFNHDEIFTGLVGQGAWLNGRRIGIGDVKEKKQAVLLTGLPVSTDFSESGLSGFVRDARLYKKMRLLGSAALSMAYVACGRADVYQENDIAVWDVAAGIAIVMGAGGIVDFRPAETENRLHVKAGNKSLVSSG
ncbi:MAG: inositol monophosphatase [Deltaproteobacteria bacterium]|nr:inositol monophosphatase [Deltaproteobacteria bacterium]